MVSSVGAVVQVWGAALVNLVINHKSDWMRMRYNPFSQIFQDWEPTIEWSQEECSFVVHNVGPTVLRD